MSDFDVVIVGAGIAGASLAAEIAPHASVLLLEAEDQPGYHATGRSAAFWSETYGGPFVQPLTTASGPLLKAGGFLKPRGALYLGKAEDEPAIAAFEREFAGSPVILERVPEAVLCARLPRRRPEWDRALSEPSCSDIDVAGLHAACLAAAKRAGAELRCASPLAGARVEGGDWALEIRGGGALRAGVLVNAAGAWADDVARIAGVRPLGIQPYRRTIAQLRVSPPPPADLPLILDINERFYFKPEGEGRIWLSPHDETACAPCDAAPEELDLAIALDRFEQAVDWRVERVEHKWAGLRSFAPDRLPVYGFDSRQPRFFWCAGQGGFGIQTAPAAAKLAGALLLGRESGLGIDPAPYAPARFG